MPRVTVSHDLIGSKRLDLLLVELMGDISRTRIKKMILEGGVSVSGHAGKLTPKSKLYAGDIIEYQLVEVEDFQVNPVPFDLDILYEDEFLLVVNKPQGMVVHPAPGHYNDTLVNYLLDHTKLSAIDARRPGIVHRIDKDTSGLLVVAKELRSHENLAAQFARHDVSRKYQALVWGNPQYNRGTIDQPLGRHPVDRKKRAIKIGGKIAITHWKVLERYKIISLIECGLETGRTHQIRVHLNSIGHSIIGDSAYGKKRSFAGKYPNELLQCLKGIKGQALHAKTLGFIHPKTQDWLEFSSELPIEMREVIRELENYKQLNLKSN